MAKTGTSWKPGESGNPAGRPPNVKYLSDLLRDALRGDNGAMAKWIIARLMLESAEGAIDATKLIFDRTEGKVALPIIGDDDAPIPVVFQFGENGARDPKDMSDAELETAKEQLDGDGDGHRS